MNSRRWALLSLAVALVLACNLPSLTSGTVAPTETPAAAGPSNGPTQTPTATQPVSAPPAGAPIASPNGQPVNCRTGPGLTYAVAAILQVGQTAEIVGKLSDGTWLEVKNPTLPGNVCWVSTSVVTTSGDLSGLQIVAAPPTPPIPPTAEAAVTVTDVSVSVSPSTIGVPGCMGPIQPSTASAAITVSGPIKLEWHFETEQNGALPIHSVNFTKAMTKDVSQSFTPPVTAGKYRVELIIDGFNLKGMNAVAFYEIHC